MFTTSFARRLATTTVIAALLLAAFATAPVASADPPRPGIRGAGSPSAIPGSYIVKLKDTASVRADGVRARAQALGDRYSGTVRHVWDWALPGFSVTMNEDEAEELAADPGVDYVEQDQRRMSSGRMTRSVTPAATQTPVSWGLDRIDQHARPLDNHYSYDDLAGEGVNAYVLSTGIRISHPDFGGRASYGPNFVTDGRPNSDDCNGLGTSVAGIVGGAQYGVAKRVSLVGIRIFGCNGISTSTSVMNGFDWVIRNAIHPAVIYFDLADHCFHPDGSPVPCDPEVTQSLIDAQEAAIAAGIAVVAGAGDSAFDTCGRSSGAAPGTFYVGASTMTDVRAPASNFGPCLDMWAPGESITTDTLTGSIVLSCTCLAGAHVAGAVALFLGKSEFAGASPDRIRDELVNNRSTPDVLTGLGPGSPNRLLFTGPPGLFTIGSSVALAVNGTGRLELFGVNTAGNLYHREQIFGSTSWSPWIQSTTTGWLSVGAEPNADGRIELTGLTPSGDIWPRAQATATPNTWFAWTRLDRPAGTTPMGRVAMAHNLSNRLQIFATNHLGQAFYRSQTGPGSKNWTAWTAFSVPTKLRSLTAVTNVDGRIEVLGVDDAGQVWRAAQTTPTDNNWSIFSRLDGFAMAAIAVAHNSNGTLELVGIDTGGGAWRRRQTSAGSSTWSNWSALPAKTLAQIAAETNINGRVHLVGVDNLGRVWQSVQTSTNSTTYPTWTQIDGILRP